MSKESSSTDKSSPDSSASEPQSVDELEGSRIVNDPIHGHIVLHPLLVKIIDTPQFQRLRHIKQLGGVYHVYPGASHNRFEHSLGVAHLAGQLVEKLRKKQPKLKVTDEEVLCVRIAGLCHDLGHGPFSHMFDQRFIREATKGQDIEWEHEDASLMMLDHLIEQNGLLKEFEKYELYPKDVKFIKELINPPKEQAYKQQPSRGFLYEIVANKRNGIDVDKWDYFRRDCHHLGIGCSFDISRTMEIVRVIGEDKDSQICFREKDAINLYQMFATRHSLYRQAYLHKTNKAIEIMLTEALLKADPHMLFTGEDGPKKMSECIHDPVAYTKLTDNVLQLIMFQPEVSAGSQDVKEHATNGSTVTDLDQARELLQRIEKRDLYKLVGEVSDTKMPKPEAKEIAQLSNKQLKEEDLYVDKAVFNFGMKEKSPFEKIGFFKKSAPDEIFHLSLEEVSSMLPGLTFQEIVYRVYCKDRSKVQVARSCFEAWEKEHKPVPSVLIGKVFQSPSEPRVDDIVRHAIATGEDQPLTTDDLYVDTVHEIHSKKSSSCSI